jgi:DNA-binding IclR family transcriptional regulator
MISKNKIFSFSSVEKALDILSCFNANRPAMSAQELSKELGLPLSSTYRYLEILTQRNFLAKSGTQKKYTLGVMLFRLGNLAASMVRLNEVALPYMEKLCQECGETVLLTVVSGSEAVCLERIEVQRLVKLSMERGVGLPLHVGASSKNLLAFMDDRFIEDYLAGAELVRLTEKTLTDKDLIRAEIETIRRQGYSFSDGEADLDARGVGAPIFDHVGRLVAGLSFAGPADRIPMQSIPTLGEMVKRVALEISEALGYTEKGKKRRDSSFSSKS